MSNKRFLLGSVDLSIDEIKKLSRYFQDVLTYDENRKLVPKKGEDGKNLKKLPLNFSIFEEGRFGQNVSFTLPQTKEQIDNNEKKTYVANGRIYYASNDLSSFVQNNNANNQQENENSTPEADDDLPF